MELSNEVIFAIERVLGLFLRIPIWAYAVSAILVALVVYSLLRRRRATITYEQKLDSTSPRKLTITTEQRNKRGKVKRRRTSVTLNHSLLKQIGGLLEEEKRSDAIEISCKRLRINRTVATKLIEILEAT